MNATMEALRCTGRTTRMLAKAKQLADEGKSVYVAFANEAQAGIAKRQAADDRIRFGTTRSPLFDWDTMRHRGFSAEQVVLVDHYAIEGRFGKVVDRLHEWDGDRKAGQ